MDEVIKTFHKEFIDLVESMATDVTDPSLYCESFMEIFIQHIQDHGWILEENYITPCKSRRGEIHGYGKDLSPQTNKNDFSEDRLDLYYCLPIGDVKNAERNKVMGGFEKLELFVKEVIDGDVIEYDIPELDELIQIIKSNFKKLNSIRFFVFTDGTSQINEVIEKPMFGKKVQCRVIDIKELEEKKDVSIEHGALIDLEKIGFSPPCIEFGIPDVDFKVFQTIFPGDLIADLYADFGGQRLLHLNVRSYLQTKRKVNAGIIRTLRTSPEKFIAFNNGLTVVANELITKNGKLIKIKGMQIVNGGQTTVSLYNQRVQNRSALGSVNIPVKIIEINDFDSNKELFMDIAKYSNSQTPIKPSDLDSLDDYFLDLEKISQKTFAPIKESSSVPSLWFFERTAGQFKVFRNQKLKGRQTKKTVKSFDDRYPSKKRGNNFSQIITKDQVGKAEMAWLQRPDEFCKGAQKCFSAYMSYLKDVKKKKGINKIVIDENYYKKIVARILLLRTLEEVIGKNNESEGYTRGFHRQQILAYSMAMISKITHKKLDFIKIWNEQRIGEEFLLLFDQLIPLIRDYLERNYKNHASLVSEWAKKTECWAEISSAINIDENHNLDLTDEIDDFDHISAEGIDQLLPITDPQAWIDLANWGKNTDILNIDQRSFLRNVSNHIIEEKDLSAKQIKWANDLWNESISEGFEFSESSYSQD